MNITKPKRYIYLLIISALMILMANIVYLSSKISYQWQLNKELCLLQAQYHSLLVSLKQQSLLQKRLQQFRKVNQTTLKKIFDRNNLLNQLAQNFAQFKLTHLNLNALPSSQTELTASLVGDFQRILFAIKRISAQIAGLKIKSISFGSDTYLNATITWEVYHY